MSDDEPKPLPAWLHDPPPAPAPPSAPEGPDKSAWGDGPWMQEPDRVEWMYRGVLCLAIRHPQWGIWLGNVAVEPGHPWHGVDKFEIQASVHGGVTYSNTQDHGPIYSLENPRAYVEHWWIGFACSNKLDFRPGYRALCRALGVAESPGHVAGQDGIEYRDLAYVKRECEQLADQLIAARRQ